MCVVAIALSLYLSVLPVVGILRKYGFGICIAHVTMRNIVANVPYYII